MGLGGFSWKRAVGISAAKAKISRSIGIPLTKGGRQRKFGAALGGNILGAAVSSKRNRSRSTETEDYDDVNSYDDECDIEAAPEIPARERNPYEVHPPGTPLTCLTLIAMLVVSIVFFPVGIAVAVVLFILLIRHADKRNNAAIQAIAAKVRAFSDRMDAATMPQVATLTRGSPDKIERLEKLRENQIRAAIIIGEVKPSERVRLFVEQLAACATMKELDDKKGDRLAMLGEMATDAGCQEAFYCITGYYTGANLNVGKVLEAAARLSAGEIS